MGYILEAATRLWVKPHTQHQTAHHHIVRLSDGSLSLSSSLNCHFSNRYYITDASDRLLSPPPPPPPHTCSHLILGGKGVDYCSSCSSQGAKICPSSDCEVFVQIHQQDDFTGSGTSYVNEPRSACGVCVCACMCVCTCVCVYTTYNLLLMIKKRLAKCWMGGKSSHAILPDSQGQACYNHSYYPLL